MLAENEEGVCCCCGCRRRRWEVVGVRLSRTRKRKEGGVVRSARAKREEGRKVAEEDSCCQDFWAGQWVCGGRFWVGFGRVRVGVRV